MCNMADEASQIPILNEYAQKRGLPLVWEDTGNLAGGFGVRVTVGENSAEGSGKRKKEAKKNAASKLVSVLRENGLLQSTAAERSPISILMEMYQQAGGTHRPTDTTVGWSGPDHSRTFTVKYSVFDYSSRQLVDIEGQGKNKQSAKEDAARNVLSELRSRNGLPGLSSLVAYGLASISPSTSTSVSSARTGTLSSGPTAQSSSLPSLGGPVSVSARGSVQPVQLVARGGLQPASLHRDPSIPNFPELPSLINLVKPVPPVPKPRTKIPVSPSFNAAETKRNTHVADQPGQLMHPPRPQEISSTNSILAPNSLVSLPLIASSSIDGSSSLQSQSLSSFETNSSHRSGLVAPHSLPASSDRCAESGTAAVYQTPTPTTSNHLSKNTMQHLSDPVTPPMSSVELGESFLSLLRRCSAIDPQTPTSPRDIQGLDSVNGEVSFGGGRITTTYLGTQDDNNQFVCFATFESTISSDTTTVPRTAIGAGNTRECAKISALESLWKT